MYSTPVGLIPPLRSPSAKRCLMPAISSLSPSIMGSVILRSLQQQPKSLRSSASSNTPSTSQALVARSPQPSQPQISKFLTAPTIPIIWLQPLYRDATPYSYQPQQDSQAPRPQMGKKSSSSQQPMEVTMSYILTAAQSSSRQ